MNDLERLKQAEETGPMAVYVRPWPKDCGHCRMLCKDEELNEHFCYVQDSLTKRIEDVSSKPDWCPLRKAIGIIEPNGHVVYLREEEE